MLYWLVRRASSQQLQKCHSKGEVVGESTSRKGSIFFRGYAVTPQVFTARGSPHLEEARLEWLPLTDPDHLQTTKEKKFQKGMVTDFPHINFVMLKNLKLLGFFWGGRGWVLKQGLTLQPRLFHNTWNPPASVFQVLGIQG